MAEKKKGSVLQRFLLAAALIIILIVVFSSLGSGGGSSSKASNSAEEPSSTPAQSESSEQVINGNTMIVTVKQFAAEDMTSSVAIGLIAQNNSNDVCNFAVDLHTATVNDTNITPVGGSLAVVKPGNKDSLAYIVPYAQFGAQSFDEVYSAELDIVQYAGESMINPDGSSTEIDRVHVVMAP